MHEQVLPQVEVAHLVPGDDLALGDGEAVVDRGLLVVLDVLVSRVASWPCNI